MAKVLETAGPDETSPLVRRLTAHVLMSDAEIEFLEGLQSNRVELSPGEEMIRDGDEFRMAYVLRRGWAIRYRLTASGGRQIMGLSLPGDIIGIQVNFYRQAISTVEALTPLEVALVEPLHILDIYRDYPVLASGLEWLTVHNYNILSEHNLSLGARTARERVLNFFLEIWCRLMQIGEAEQDGFHLALTQTQIADAMGLSQVHTNRTMRRLKDEGLIKISRKVLTFPDVDAAIAAADFDNRFLAPFRQRKEFRNDPGRLVRGLQQIE